MRVLVVDDSAAVRKAICTLLSTHPIFTPCGEACDGIDAIETAQTSHPNIVLMDISMPKMDGLEATREITRVLPEAKVVVVSQHESPELIRQAMSDSVPFLGRPSVIHQQFIKVGCRWRPWLLRLDS